jgi:hypothetical protein
MSHMHDRATPAARTAARPTPALLLLLLMAGAQGHSQSTSLNGHAVVLDGQQKIVTWMTPSSTAFDRFLDLRWNFVKAGVPMSPGPAPRSSHPLYYFFNGYVTNEPTIEPDWWMNDVGEKIPNWFESARLYYAYTGDASVMGIAGGLVDYAIGHGTSASTFPWPNFPYTTTNAGDTEFRGFTGRFALHEIQVDHAGDMGLTYYRMYLYTGDGKYLTAARNVADVLAAKARTGTATQSVWPYRVVMSTGTITAQYGANWIGAYALLDALVHAGIGDVAAYQAAKDKARAFILAYPMVTGYWTDGHTDNAIDSNTYRSNLSKSNAALYILDNPDFDPGWRAHIPQLIQWTETYFVSRTTGGEPATEWGANIVGEQDVFLYKMDYQTARYAAENAKWYAASGDASAREKAYRALSWVTYCSNASGRATEMPYTTSIATWFSDCYGEAPRMFYHVFAAIPEWAPPGEDHILYSQGVLRDVAYAAGQVSYAPTDGDGTEYLRLTFSPASVTVGGVPLALRTDLAAEGYTVRSLGGGDYAVNVRRLRPGPVVVSAIPAATPSLEIDDVQVTEGSGVTTTAVFTVRLSAASAQSVTVDYATADGGAVAPGDYAATSGALSFPAGATKRTVTVPVVGDHVDEPDETFLVNLSSPVGATPADAQGVGTILDDDAPGLSIEDVDVVEPLSGTRAAVFTVALSPANAGTVTVGWATAAVTATPGSDYDDSSGSLSFAPGTTTRSLSVTIRADAVTEGVETFHVDLSGASGAPIASGQATGRIHDPGDFYAVAPCRVVDTRRTTGAYGGPALAAGETRPFTLAGRCGIPASARAVAVNATVAGPTVAGHLRLYPADGAVPPASTLNYGAGQTRANNAVIGLSAAGALAVWCGQTAGTTHFVLDVTGYFE